MCRGWLRRRVMWRRGGFAVVGSGKVPAAPAIATACVVIRVRERGVGRPEFGQAEVEELGAARRQHDVGGLQIAMDDALSMRVRRARSAISIATRDSLVERQRSPRQPRGQRLALEILHDEEMRSRRGVRRRAACRCAGAAARRSPAPRARNAAGTASRHEAASPGRTLMATRRLSRVSVAQKTWPMPPAPIGCSMRYGPRMAPACRSGSVSKRRRGSRPHRSIEEDRPFVLPQERFDLRAEGDIAGALLRQKDLACGGVLVNRQFVDSDDALPALGSYGHGVRCFHARCSFGPGDRWSCTQTPRAAQTAAQLTSRFPGTRNRSPDATMPP